MDDTSLFWSDGSGVMQVMRGSNGGGGASALFLGVLPYSFSGAGNQLFWSTSSSIYQADKAGGSPTEIASDYISDLTVGASHVAYWRYDDPNNWIAARAFGGGAPQSLPDDPVSDPIGAPDMTIWQLAADGSDVYAIAKGLVGYELFRLPLDGGPSTSLVELDTTPARIRGINAELVVLSAQTAGCSGNPYFRFWGVPKQGGDAFEIVSGQTNVGAAAVDDHRVYWSDACGDGSIWKTSVGGGQPVLVAQGFRTTFAMHLRGEYLYFAANDGRIYRVAK